MALLSWIEKDGEILYITDKEYLSKEWKNKMHLLRHNDALGHGAIRDFYEFSGGIGHEVRDFWNTYKIPQQLQIQLEDFNKNFNVLFANCMTNHDLTNIILNAPDYTIFDIDTTLPIKAFYQLTKQNPSKTDLIKIINTYLEQAYYNG